MTIPKSVTRIGDRAFAGCRSLKILTIPHSVRDIGTNVVMGCSSLNKMPRDLSAFNARDHVSDPTYGGIPSQETPEMIQVMD